MSGFRISRSIVPGAAFLAMVVLGIVVFISAHGFNFFSRDHGSLSKIGITRIPQNFIVTDSSESSDRSVTILKHKSSLGYTEILVNSFQWDKKEYDYFKKYFISKQNPAFSACNPIAQIRIRHTHPQATLFIATCPDHTDAKRRVVYRSSVAIYRNSYPSVMITAEGKDRALQLAAVSTLVQSLRLKKIVHLRLIVLL